MAQQCWELLRECWQWCANGCNNSQQCWDLLRPSEHEAKRLTGFKRCATTPNNLQHSVQTDATMFGSCWPRILRLFVRSFIETGQTFSYMQTDETTLNNVGSCWPTILRLFARDFSYVDSKTLKPRANGRNFFANNSQHCWMLHVASVCTLCCMLLRVVAQRLKPDKRLAKAACKRTQQLPTLLRQQWWKLLRPCW